MKNNKKLVALVCCVLMLVGAAGATLAWLTDQTQTVTNTFAPSDINIELTETDTTKDENGNDKKSFDMVPGWTIDKDPVVTVKAGSEDCWVFVEATKAGGNITLDNKTYNFDDFIKFEIDKNNWTELEEGVYYCYSKDISSDRSIKVLLNNQVTVKDTVTKDMMDALQADMSKCPNLVFKAYAVQYWQSNNTPFTPEEAWNVAKGLE